MPNICNIDKYSKLFFEQFVVFCSISTKYMQIYHDFVQYYFIFQIFCLIFICVIIFSFILNYNLSMNFLIIFNVNVVFKCITFLDVLSVSLGHN